MNNNFPDNRLTGDTELRQGQLVMLRLLKIFDSICKKHNLCYWLEGGTLLGAVRHKGFIPWDDDLDVCMPLDDYIIYKNLPPQEFPYDVYSDSSLEFLKLKDRFSKRLDANTDSDASFNSVYMDIFPMEKRPFGRKIFARLRMLIPPYAPPEIYAGISLKKRIKRYMAHILYYLINYTGLSFLIRFLSNLGKKNVWTYNITITWHFHYPDKWIFPLTTLTFEDFEAPCPKEYHKLLTYQFKNYMQFPPENERNHHHNQSILVTTPCNNPNALNWEDYH